MGYKAGLKFVQGLSLVREARGESGVLQALRPMDYAPPSDPSRCIICPPYYSFTTTTPSPPLNCPAPVPAPAPALASRDISRCPSHATVHARC